MISLGVGFGGVCWAGVFWIEAGWIAFVCYCVSIELLVCEHMRVDRREGRLSWRNRESGVVCCCRIAHAMRAYALDVYTYIPYTMVTTCTPSGSPDVAVTGVMGHNLRHTLLIYRG